MEEVRGKSWRDQPRGENKGPRETVECLGQSLGEDPLG